MPSLAHFGQVTLSLALSLLQEGEGRKFFEYMLISTLYHLFILPEEERKLFEDLPNRLPLSPLPPRKGEG